MQTEPSKADPPKRRRRWYQFSLRTLLIVMGAFLVFSVLPTTIHAIQWGGRGVNVWPGMAIQIAFEIVVGAGLLFGGLRLRRG